MKIKVCLQLLITSIAIGACADSGVTTPPIENDPGGTVNATRLGVEDLYDIAPDVAACREGRLKTVERDKVLNYVNAIRANAGLPLVQYRADDNERVDKAALIIAANTTLSHQPPSSMTCWSQAGYDGSSTSNLGIMIPYGSGKIFAASEAFIDMWMKDSNVSQLGHRRWLLDPFLKYIAFGRVDRSGGPSGWGASGGVIRVIHDERQDLSNSTLEFVAFPYHVTSTNLFNSDLLMSLSALVDRNDFWKNDQVDFSSARIDIRDPNGATVPVTIVGADTYAYGLANVLTWTAPVNPEVRYSVSVRNVLVRGQQKSWDYWFTLARPS